MANFDLFVVLAEMRTGSNFLEANLNAFDGVTCHGEAFNPHFVGYPNSKDILGITRDMREADPDRLLNTIRQMSGGLGGFRFFNDHDPRALERVLPDPRCAKIVLTRNPIDSYISWKIARATGQWKLTNAKHVKRRTVRFDAEEFETHLAALQSFQMHILNTLQKTGQTAFYVAYEDLQDLDVMNGLAAWLGIDARLDSLDKKLKKQNPEPMSEKVENFAVMEAALAGLDRFDLHRTPNFEPRRAPAVPTYVAAAESPLLYLPVRSGPEEAVKTWLAALDGVGQDDLLTGFSQQNLRKWKRQRPGHRSFTVLRHPLARAHAAFCDRILSTGPGGFSEIRATLKRAFKLPLPASEDAADYDADAHRAAFRAFLEFLRKNLGGQTSVRVDGHWASQSSVIEGYGKFVLPDMILREERLAEDLTHLAAQIDRTDAPPAPAATDPHHDALAAIYDTDLEPLARDIYQRDYMLFGFGDWPGAAPL